MKTEIPAEAKKKSNIVKAEVKRKPASPAVAKQKKSAAVSKPKPAVVPVPAPAVPVAQPPSVFPTAIATNQPKSIEELKRTIELRMRSIAFCLQCVYAFGNNSQGIISGLTIRFFEMIADEMGGIHTRHTILHRDENVCELLSEFIDTTKNRTHTETNVIVLKDRYGKKLSIDKADLSIEAKKSKVFRNAIRLFSSSELQEHAIIEIDKTLRRHGTSLAEEALRATSEQAEERRKKGILGISEADQESLIRKAKSALKYMTSLGFEEGDIFALVNGKPIEHWNAYDLALLRKKAREAKDAETGEVKEDSLVMDSKGQFVIEKPTGEWLGKEEYSAGS